MGDYAIRARFESDSDPENVLKWLIDARGIAGWWSDTVEGDASEVGDRFVVRFPTTDVPFQLEVVDKGDGAVQWHVPESPPWWKGTDIRFEVGTAPDGSTSVLFVHSGFDANDPIIEVITPAWVGFVNNLIEVARNDSPNPVVVN